MFFPIKNLATATQKISLSNKDEVSRGTTLFQISCNKNPPFGGTYQTRNFLFKCSVTDTLCLSFYGFASVLLIAISSFSRKLNSNAFIKLQILYHTLSTSASILFISFYLVAAEGVAKCSHHTGGKTFLNIFICLRPTTKLKRCFYNFDRNIFLFCLLYCPTSLT